MDTVLLVITLISAATAIVALASARRVRRHERERSEARVAALASAADTHGSTDGGWTSVAGEWQWNPTADGTRDSGFGIRAATGITRSSREARPARIPNPQSPIPDVEPQISSGAFFGTVQREEPSGSRLPILCGGGVDRDVGRRADFSEHVGVERSRGDRRAGEPLASRSSSSRSDTRATSAC